MRLSARGMLFTLIPGCSVIAVAIWMQPEQINTVNENNTGPRLSTDHRLIQNNNKIETLSQVLIDTPVLGALPASLRGTQVTGVLQQDKAGHLILNQKVRYVFDHFFTARGEESQAQIRARIARYIKAQLSEPALGEALQLLDKYITYHDHLMGYKEQDTEETLQVLPWGDKEGLLAVDDLLAARQNVRNQIFNSVENEALFGEDIAYDELSMAILKASSNQDLTQAQAQQLVSQLERSLPQTLYDQRQKSYSAMRLKNAEIELKQGNASAAEIYQKRSALVGDAAAQRLALVDKQRQSWNLKRQTYLLQQKDIMSHTGLTDEGKQRAMDHLMQDTLSLSAPERVRMRALDQIALINKS